MLFRTFDFQSRKATKTARLGARVSTRNLRKGKSIVEMPTCFNDFIQKPNLYSLFWAAGAT